MAKRVITFGEIMLRLAPEGYYRFVQAFISLKKVHPRDPLRLFMTVLAPLSLQQNPLTSIGSTFSTALTGSILRESHRP